MLLISDLGTPGRFLNMLRVFKVTSPMSVGSWILAAAGAPPPWPPRTRRPASSRSSGVPQGRPPALLGLPLATYTAALVSNTAVPVWHGARGSLPFVFAAGAAASAGGAPSPSRPPARGPARRLAVGGAVARRPSPRELMEKALGELGEPYSRPASPGSSRAAGALALAGAALIAAGRDARAAAAIAGGGVLTAGALLARWSVYRAGFQSAADPKYTVGPQRARVERGEARGATRKVRTNS